MYVLLFIIGGISIGVLAALALLSFFAAKTEQVLHDIHEVIG